MTLEEFVDAEKRRLTQFEVWWCYQHTKQPNTSSFWLDNKSSEAWEETLELYRKVERINHA